VARKLRIFGTAVLLALIAAAPSMAAGPVPGQAFRECSGCPEMVVLPAGEFVMGADSRFAAEGPAHPVAIPRPFAVSRTEVTFDQWEACVADGGCAREPDDHGWGRGPRPVINVSWDDAAGYAGWLSRKTGAHYRLPSEAEWEYAARGGTGTAYWWGDAAGQGNANCRDCAAEPANRTLPVGGFRPNPFGLHDMLGNVWEWTRDCWHPDHRGAPTGGEAREDGDCRYRVTRGGSWYYVHTNLRAAYRSKFPVQAFSYGIGVRVVRDLP